MAVLINSITAYFSIGYFHPDEHFQIIEFAEYKANNSTESSLPWEYQANIRPAFQPFLAFSLISFIRFLGLNESFLIAFIIRLFQSFLSIVSIFLFLNVYVKKSELNKYLFYTYFLWFIPFLSVRFSSEILAASLFLIVLYNLKKLEPNYFVAGILAGFSFQARFQLGFMIAGLIIWIILYAKPGNKRIFNFFSGITITFIVAIILDYWLYGKFTFPPYNYLFSNILENKAAGWGTESWYWYFEKTIINTLPFFGIIIIPLLFYYFIKNLKSELTFSIIPFLLIHIIVGHKEFRFLFPIAFIIPFIIITTINLLKEPLSNYIKKYLNLIFLSFNTLFLIIFMFIPADFGFRTIEFLNNKSISNLVCYDESPFYRSGLNLNFYKPDSLKIQITNSYNEIIKSSNQYVLINKEPNKFEELLNYEKKKYLILHQTYPNWVINYFNFNNWLERSKYLKIYKIN